MSLKPVLAAAAFCVAAPSAIAQVRVEDAWVRATVPQQHATAAFMKITADQPVRLVGARSTAAPTVEVHEMKMANNVMTMRETSGIDIAPGRTLALTPSGYHMMLLDLQKQIKVGDAVPLTLVFEDAAKKRSSIEVIAQARALSAGAAAPMAGMASMPRLIASGNISSGRVCSRIRSLSSQTS